MTALVVPFHIKLLHLFAPKLAKKLMVDRMITEQQQTADARIHHMQSPPVLVPSMADVLSADLTGLNLPNVQAMMDGLNGVFHSGTNEIWEQSANPDKPAQPNAFFGLHPNVSVSKALRQIIGTAFPEETFLEIGTHLTDHTETVQGQPKPLREDRVTYMYVLVSFIDGNAETAEYIETRVPLTRDIKALRTQVMHAKSLYDPQAKVDPLAKMGAVFNDLFAEFEQASKTGTPRTVRRDLH